MSELPSGTVSFLFTDVEGSTMLWERDRRVMAVVVARHDQIVREAVAEFGGYVFATAGDSFSVAFPTAASAIGAAGALQQRLTAEEWPASVPLRVRMGVHVGEADERDGDYFGSEVNRTARLMGRAAGGQVLLSASVVELVRDAVPDDLDLLELGEVQLRGFRRPERVWQLCGTGLIGEFPPVEARAVGVNLPSPATSFVGREDDLDDVTKLVETDLLVTLVGPGGIGKTRLSIEAARRCLAQFPAGVWFCELAPVTKASGIVPALADSVGVQLRSADPLGHLAEVLAHRRALVILDNCEHLADEVAEVAQRLIAHSTDLRVMCTTREALGVDGERIYAVPPIGGAGIELFCDRARSQLPDFNPTTEELGVIEQICRELDGMPLAIELAASRVRSLGLHELLSRLHDRFRLLRGSRRGSVERHQTLLNTVRWSYDLLESGERLLFDRLSVFAGSFDLSAVELVCTDEVIDQPDVLDLLEALISKSLVLTVGGGQRPRFRLMETMRQFAADQLSQRGPSDPWLDRHARHYSTVAAELEIMIVSPAERDAWQAFAADWDNLRAAFEHAMARSDSEVVATIPVATAWWAVCASRFEAGLWARRAVDSGLVDHHPLEIDVRGAWALWAYWVLDDREQAWSAIHAQADRLDEDRRGLFPGAWVLVSGATGDREALAHLTARWDTINNDPPLGIGDIIRAGYVGIHDPPDQDVEAIVAAAHLAANRIGSPSWSGVAHMFEGLIRLRSDPAAAITTLEAGFGRLREIADDHFFDIANLTWYMVALVQADRAYDALEPGARGLIEWRDRNARQPLLDAVRTAAFALADHKVRRYEAAALAIGAVMEVGHETPYSKLVDSMTIDRVTAGLGSDLAKRIVTEGRSLTIEQASDKTLVAIDAATTPTSPA